MVIIDTVSNSNNIWKDGPPKKGFLSDAHSPSNVIITDTINPYPANDTSVFTIWHGEKPLFSAPGTYYYQLLNEKEKKGSWGKFLVDK